MENVLSTEMVAQLEELQTRLSEGIIKKVEGLTKKFELALAEKDREIAALRAALAQSAKDFKNLHDATK